MDTEKAWEEFQNNDSSIRKSESVQQDIQQILDTVTQIKSDVDQLKEEGPQATGIADEEPSLSADNQPPAEAPPMEAPAEEPQAPMGDLMAQPEDGAAEPAPEEAPAEEPAPEAAPADDMGAGDLSGLLSRGEGMEEMSDEDVILDAVRDVKDPELKKQLLALAYQSIEAKSAPPIPPMPPEEQQLPPEILEAVAAEVPPEALMDSEPMMRSATESVQCDANPATEMKEAAPAGPVAASDDEDKKEESEDDEPKDEKEDSEDKKEEPFEPGVTGMPESKDEDNDATEETPVVTEITVEGDADAEPAEDEKTDAIESIVDTILEEAKEKISEQVVEAIDGIEDADSFMLSTSTSDMMKARYGKKMSRGFRRSIDWPETFEGVSMDDKCRYFAKSWNSMDRESQDAVIGLMDRAVGAEKTNAIFKSEGVNLDAIYKSAPVAGECSGNTAPMQESHYGTSGYRDSELTPVDPHPKDPEDEAGWSARNKELIDMNDNVINDVTHRLAQKNGGRPVGARKDVNEIAKKTKPVQDSDDAPTEPLEECKKSADVGIHIPTVSEMMTIKKSGRSAYTAMPREMSEPHGLVPMGESQEIPSTRELMARFTKQ